VVQGRFKSILVDRDSYLLELCRYVVLNPVRARMTRKPETYGWSSYRATAGLDAVPSFLRANWVLGQFATQRAAAQRRYARFVAEGLRAASPWEHVQGQVLLGDAAFVERMTPALHDKQHFKEIPRRQRFAHRPSLSKLFTPAILGDQARRNAAIRAAHVEYGYSLSQIGAAVELHYSTISRIVAREEA
jgi:hypothetical protein